MQRAMATIMAASLSIAAVAACGGSGGPASTTEAGRDVVTVSVLPIVNDAALQLGAKNGIFESHGITLQIEPGAQSGAAGVAAVLSGTIDFGTSAVTPILTAAATDVPVKIIGPETASTTQGEDFFAIVTRPDTNITSFKQLEGKVVATNALRNYLELTTRLAVEQDGGSGDEVQFLEIPFPEMLAALQAERVDAIYVVEPFVTMAKQAGMTVVGYPSRSLGDQPLVSVYYTSATFAQERPEVLERLIAALKECQQYAEAHSDEVRQVLEESFNIPLEIASEMVLPKYVDELDLSSLQAAADAMVSAGFIDASPDLSSLVID